MKQICFVIFLLLTTVFLTGKPYFSHSGKKVIARRIQPKKNQRYDYMSDMESDRVILYMRPQCPYCQKVLRALEKYGKTLETRDIANEKYRDELLEIGGKQQVPCIVVEGTPLYESDDIIAWLEKHYKTL